MKFSDLVPMAWWIHILQIGFFECLKKFSETPFIIFGLNITINVNLWVLFQRGEVSMFPGSPRAPKKKIKHSWELEFPNITACSLLPYVFFKKVYLIKIRILLENLLFTACWQSAHICMCQYNGGLYEVSNRDFTTPGFPRN